MRKRLTADSAAPHSKTQYRNEIQPRSSQHAGIEYSDTLLALLCHKFQVPQKGQRQSFWSRERASKMRNVAMEYGLCRCGRMRASGLEVGRDLGSW